MADVKISALTAATGLTDDDVFVVNDGSTTKKITAANASGYFGGHPQNTATGGGYWHRSLASDDNPSGAAFPIINRMYVTPIYISEPCTVTGLALNMTAAADASNVVRLGLYQAGSDGYPGTILDQGTVAADSTGAKTATVSIAVTPGWHWLAAAPQGTGAPGSTWQFTGRHAMNRFRSTASDASWVALASTTALYSAFSSTFTDSPTMTRDTSSNRIPLIAMKVA